MNCERLTYSPPKSLAALTLVAISFFLGVSAIAGDSIPIDQKTESDIVEVEPSKLINNEKWNKLVHKLEKKSDLPQAYFIDYLFYKTHQVLLKNYRKHSNFDELLEFGNYDCVSASLAYSYILKHFDIPHSIIETDFHVFLVIRIENRDYIYESTDPINGFIKYEDKVLEFIANFRPGKKIVPNKQIQGQGELLSGEESHINTIYKEINSKQLVGLQYYNQAIYAINLKEYELAKQKMSQALQLYPSERIQSVFQYIAQLK